MKFNYTYLFIFIFLYSCVQETKVFKEPEGPAFSSKGFALIYEDSDFEKGIVDNKLINDQNFVLHSFLNSGVLVTIYNPFNSKSLTAKVKKISNYPSIYNIVITKKMANDLSLDIMNPYVEVVKIKKNDKFIAKEASIFEEEKKVADKAPVESISINDLSASKSKKKIKKKEYSYIIDIAEFYYYESAQLVKNRFENEANLFSIKIKEISKTKFKVYAGPYDSFNSMKEIYLAMNKLGFENLNITNIKK